MQNLIFKKGYDLRLSGIPERDVEEAGKPSRIGVTPRHIPFVVPRLRVEKGSRVNIGTPLFEDKRNPDLVFLSPGGGVIADIRYGERRVIRDIVIDLDDDETMEPFDVAEPARLDSMDRGEIVSRLVRGGVWAYLRELPFRDIAGRIEPPESIVVVLDGLDPFAPSPSLYLKGVDDLFLYGLSVMGKLSKTVHVVAAGDTGSLPEKVSVKVTHAVDGPYPSQDPGVFLYHVKKSPEENRAFYIDGQDLVLLARLMRDGVYPTWKVLAVGGPLAARKNHVRARVGCPVSALGADIGPSVRVVGGGVMKGVTVPRDSFVGYYESGLTLLEEGNEEDFFGFLRPGFHRPSYTRTFLSVFNRKSLPLTCNMRGELRPCINCGTCASLCPVDILPQFTFKCLQAGEVEEGLAHGLLDCVECSLCTYVCPSKIDVCGMLRKAKADYYKERA